MLPEFHYIPSFPFSSPPRLPIQLHTPTKTNNTYQTIPINDVVVLICGHAGRDLRCGVMGPLLQREFEQKLAAAGIEISTTSPAAASDHAPTTTSTTQEAHQECRQPRARVGLISHIGGHRFAGNVIIYVPPAMMAGQTKHALAGMGIWYGRVEPRHVEGIVAETVLGGSIIRDLSRGGIDGQRRMLRL